jgi:hypothetical protein
MSDLLGGGVMGALLGWLFRLAPEVIKMFDRRGERDHEFRMFEKQCDLEKVRGQNKLDEIGAQRALSIDTGVMSAFQASIDQQAAMAKAAGGWVASLSASVRPVLTYYLLILYGVVKLAVMLVAIQTDQPYLQVFVQIWSKDDMALLSGAINYWLMDRTLSKRGLL